MESVVLEKTSKIIKSNRQPITTMPTKPCPQGHVYMFLKPCAGMVTLPLLWAAWANA